MHTPLRYEVLEQVVSVITVCRPLVELIKHKDRDLACQLRRALSSAGLNVAEAFGNSSGNARLRFLAAKGSLYEAQAAIQMAVAWGYFRNDNLPPRYAQSISLRAGCTAWQEISSKQLASLGTTLPVNRVVHFGVNGPQPA